MTEEEKKAIEILKFNLCDYEELDSSVLEDIQKDINIVLNLISKLQKENEEIINQRNDLAFALSEKEEDIEIKYKVIDEMAEYIENVDYTEQLCEYCINNKKDCTKEECIEEIKQYFYGEVENNDNSTSNKN